MAPQVLNGVCRTLMQTVVQPYGGGVAVASRLGHVCGRFGHTLSAGGTHSRSALLRCATPVATPSPVCYVPRCSAHTKGDQELLSFLDEEIEVESRNQKLAKLPSRIDDFSIKLDQSEVTFEKKHENETVAITLNVNHTVDSEFPESEQVSQSIDKPEAEDLKSRPNFEVTITKGNRSMLLSCSFIQDEFSSEEGHDQHQQQQYDDVFSIDEISVYEGDWSEKTYSVAGDIIDGVLYDMMMNLLEERGVSTEFVNKMSDFCSAYEHKCYIALLEGIKGFVSGGK